MNTPNRVTKWSLVLGIMIVMNLFFNYAISLVYERPDYSAFCPISQVVTQPQTQNECTSQGGQWTDNSYYGKPTSVNEPRGYCDLEFTCRQDYDTANKSYERNVFVVLVLLGAISVFIGSYFRSNEVIASGLSLAGVLSFIIASMRYWSAANNLFRVVILLIALALLFYVAMKKFRNSNVGIQS